MREIRRGGVADWLKSRQAAASITPRLPALTLILLLVSCVCLAQPPGHVVEADAAGGLQAVEAACAGSSASPCVVVIRAPFRVVLATAHTTPAGMRLRFEPGGMLEVRGAPLTIGSGVVESAGATRLFADGSVIRGLDAARPEWFGDVAPGGYPAAALAQAYRATKVWGRILLGNAAYLSPFFDPASGEPCGGNFPMYDSPRIFLGAGRPTVDDERNPQVLQGGTILRGGVCGSAALDAYHLGLDEGPWVVSHLFGGHNGYGLVLGQGPGLHQVRGTVLEDVAVLTNGMQSQHSVIIEGQDEAAVRGLWLWSVGGTHGLIIKSSRSSVRDFHCRGAAADCLLVKSDAATSGAGYASDVDVDGVDIAALRQPGDTGGIAIDSSWDTVHHLTLDHVTERGTSFGIAGWGSIFYTPHDVIIRDWTAEVTDYCLSLNRSRDVAVERFRCAVSGGSRVFPAVVLLGDRTSLSDGVLSCMPGVPRCGGGAVDGILDLGKGTRFQRITGDGLTGYLLRTGAGGLPSTDGLATRGMDGRLSSPYAPPPESSPVRRRRWIATVKPPIRIVVTTLMMRLRLLRRSSWIAIAAVLAAAVRLWRFRRRRQIREAA